MLVLPPLWHSLFGLSVGVGEGLVGEAVGLVGEAVGLVGEAVGLVGDAVGLVDVVEGSVDVVEGSVDVVEGSVDVVGGSVGFTSSHFPFGFFTFCGQSQTWSSGLKTNRSDPVEFIFGQHIRHAFPSAHL